MQLDAKLEVSTDDYVESFKTTLVDVVYRWVRPNPQTPSSLEPQTPKGSN